jgi:hypothetical protein
VTAARYNALAMRVMATALASVLLAITVASSSRHSLGEGGRERGPETTDLAGRPVDPLHRDSSVRVSTLVFVRTDCPISNRYAPEIERVRARFEARQARTWIVYLDADLKTEDIAAHRREYRVETPGLRDRSGQLARSIGVTVVPEAAVFVHDGERARLVYRGRIDNQYTDLARHRPRATQFDLRDALERALTRPPEQPVLTPAVGCLIEDTP